MKQMARKPLPCQQMTVSPNGAPWKQPKTNRAVALSAEAAAKLAADAQLRAIRHANEDRQFGRVDDPLFNRGA